MLVAAYLFLQMSKLTNQNKNKEAKTIPPAHMT